MSGWRVQGLRFIVVGCTSNVALYLLYLLTTRLGLAHRWAMTLSYVIGIGYAFVFNRCWTFTHDSFGARAFWRYLASYFIGYLANLAGLLIFVDYLSWPHWMVQGLLVFGIGLGLFVAQRNWVFTERAKNATTAETV